MPPIIFWKLFKSTGSISFYIMYKYFAKKNDISANEKCGTITVK